MARVIVNARLHRVSLINNAFELKPPEAGARVQFGFDRVIAAHHYDGKSAGTTFRWSAFAHSGEARLFSCVTDWIVQYVNLDECDPAAIFEFAQRHGTMTSYPYFRGFVAQLSWASGFSLPPMPVITANAYPPISLAELDAESEPPTPTRPPGES